MFKKEVMDRL